MAETHVQLAVLTPNCLKSGIESCFSKKTNEPNCECSTKGQISIELASRTRIFQSKVLVLTYVNFHYAAP